MKIQFVREISQSDELEILKIRNNPEIFKWFFNDSPITTEIHRKWVADRVKFSKNYTLVAEFNGKVIGTAYLDEPQSLSPKISISVSPDFRKDGTGTSLLVELISRAKKGQMKSIRAEILKSNSSSLKFFEKNGFSRIGSETHALTKSKKEVVLLYLNLVDQ